MRIGLVGCAGVLWLGLVGLPVAWADTFVVNATGSTDDASPGDGACLDDVGMCTLRAAAQETNVLAGPDVIGIPPGTYAGSTVVFTDDVEIVGAGAGVTTLDGENVRRILDVNGTTAIVRGLRFTRGAGSGGGAIFAYGTLTVEDCTFDANVVTSTGGAISSSATLTVRRSTFMGNEAPAGGGIFIDDGMVTIEASTFDANVGGGNAAGLHAQGTSNVTIENVTFANGTSGPGIIFAAGATGTLRHVTIAGHEWPGLTVYSPATAIVTNTIIAGNSLGGFDEQCTITGTYTSLGGSLASDGSCALNAAFDLEDTDPLLGPLNGNGGPTETMAPSAGSDAIDGALGAECLPADQRGAARPVGAACDRGAYEVGGSVPTTTTTTFPTTTTSTSSTTTTSSSTSTTSTSTSFTTSTSAVPTSTVTTTTLASSTTTTSTSTSTTATSTTGTVSTSSTTSTTVAASTTTSTSVTTTTLPVAVFPAARKLVVKATRSGAQRLRIVVKDPSVASPAECAVDGALMIQAGGGMVAELPLDAALWRPLKAKRPERGCKYGKGPVVATVKVKAGKGFKVVAKGDDLGVPLATDPRPVRIELRHGAVRHCLEFGVATGKHVPDKKLIAKRAVAASTCPGE